MSLINKVAIVTGGSSGIGSAIAIKFAKEGANVAIVARNEKKFKPVLQQCKKSGKQAIAIKADISKDDDAERIIKETVNQFGKIDILVNNAGILGCGWGSVLDGKIVETYDKIMAINTRAAIQLTTLASSHIVETQGNIINVSSTGAEQLPKLPIFLPYCVSKIALEHFTKGAALELSVKGVRVNCIRPGPVKTNALETYDFEWDDLIADTALNRLSEPEEIAELAVYIASNKGEGITGSIFTIDNGFMLKTR